METQLKCYQITDGETHFVADHDEDEARSIYARDIDSDEDAVTEAKIVEVSRSAMANVKVRMTIADLFDDVDGPCILAGTVE